MLFEPSVEGPLLGMLVGYGVCLSFAGDGKEVSIGGTEKSDRSTVLGVSVGDFVDNSDGACVTSGGRDHFEISTTPVAASVGIVVGDCGEIPAVGICVCDKSVKQTATEEQISA